MEWSSRPDVMHFSIVWCTIQISPGYVIYALVCGLKHLDHLYSYQKKITIKQQQKHNQNIFKDYMTSPTHM